MSEKIITECSSNTRHESGAECWLSLAPPPFLHWISFQTNQGGSASHSVIITYGGIIILYVHSLRVIREIVMTGNKFPRATKNSPRRSCTCPTANVTSNPGLTHPRTMRRWGGGRRRRNGLPQDTDESQDRWGGPPIVLKEE